MTNNAQFPQIALSARELTLIRGGRLLFAGLDLDVAGGSALLLRGPNGAGKSSLLLALAGLIRHEGEICFSAGGSRIEDVAPLIHFAGHRHAIKADLTLAENLEFWADMLGGDRALVEPALVQAGLEGLGAYSARNLSAGQSHRLALARLLVAPRPIWLLDEPSSALDAAGDRFVAQLIESQLALGGMVIAATHRDIPFSEKAAIHVLEMGWRVAAGEGAQ